MDVAEAFRAAAEDIQRPVDLLGLLEIAGMTETAEIVLVDTIRPDRTRRRFALGGVAAANPAGADRSRENE